jgi:hypothetical protein
MPRKRSLDISKEPAECILRCGKTSNNELQWAEEMQTAVTALYGLTGMFFTTNRRYRPPRVSEEAILNALYESDVEEDDNEEVEENSGDECRTHTSSQGCGSGESQGSPNQKGRKDPE